MFKIGCPVAGVQRSGRAIDHNRRLATEGGDV